MASLLLADHAYFCLSQGFGVFLDLKKDSYSAVPLEAPNAIDAESLSLALSMHAQELAAEGLLDNEGKGRPLDSFQGIRRCREHFIPEFDRRAFGVPRGRFPAVRVGVWDLVSVLCASWRASRRLKRRHIKDLVEQAASRRARLGRPQSNERLRKEVIKFAKARPFYPRDYLCLFDSVALLEFLEMRGFRAQWVFGVQAQPFAAHCWLQVDDLCLNDNVEYCRQFTPILAA